MFYNFSLYPIGKMQTPFFNALGLETEKQIKLAKIKNSP